MGRLAVCLNTGGVHSDELTALKKHLLEGMTAVTNDSDDEIVEGDMPDKSGTALTVPTNGKVLIPKGYHDGEQYALNVQSTMAGTTVTPMTTQQTVATKDKLMQDNVIVAAIPNQKVSGQIANSCNLYNNYLYYRIPYGWYPNTYTDTECEVRIVQASVAAALSLTAAKLFKNQVVAGITGTAEGYVKDNTTKIYHGGTNYDGYTENSSYVQSGYYSVSGTWTIETTQEYDCDRATGVLVQCHKNNTNNTSSVAVYVYDTVAAAWQLVKSQTIETANSADPAAHYFNLGCKSGKLKLRFVLKYVNVTSIRMYI